MPKQTSLNLILKLKKAGLTGRGGAAFPTHLKWSLVKKAPGPKKFVIANGSEGEPGVLKDGYLLKKYPEQILRGIELAMQTVNAQQAYLYLRKDYYQLFRYKLTKLIGKRPIKLFKEPGGYLCGEETTMIESIEGNHHEPRLTPPYPPENGLFGCPTLVNNLETLWTATLIADNQYKNQRLFSITGAVKNPGVYELPGDWNIRKVLQKTGNLPRTKFFIQFGGGVSGEILTQKELTRKPNGTAAITVYSEKDTDLKKLMQSWTDFYYRENCGKCTPCREGLFRLKTLLDFDTIDLKLLNNWLLVLEKTSFCGLGKSVATPFKSLINKIWLKRKKPAKSPSL